MSKRFTIGLLLIVSVCLGLCLIFGCGVEQVPIEITGVTVLGTEVSYDGTEHSVTISGLLEGDEVYYSESDLGPWSDKNPAYTVPGRYVVYCKVVRAGFAEHIAFAEIKILRGILSGISASDETYIYDGTPHGISINGVRDTDSVAYSIDGESFSDKLELVETGEYTVFYRVSRGYFDFADSCKVTVLPSIAGTYVNSEHGVAVLFDRTANINGNELPLVYAVDGSGFIGADGFSVENGTLKFRDAEYRLIGADEFVYRLTSGDSTAYAVVGDTAEFRVEFSDYGATVKLEDAEILNVPSVNYCERVSDGTVRRGYADNNVAFSVVAVGRVNNIELEFSLRERLDFSCSAQTVLYDGSAHELNVEFDGQVLYADGAEYVERTPKFTDIGSYSVELLLLSDKFLPERVTVGFNVMPDISGVYYFENSVIEIDGMTAELCGGACEYAYSNGELKLGGKLIEITENGITIGDEEYAMLGADETLTLLDIDGVFMIFTNIVNLVFTVRGDTFEVVVNDEETFTFELGDGTGLRVAIGDQMTDLTESGTSSAVFGKAEFEIGAVTYVEIRTV